MKLFFQLFLGILILQLLATSSIAQEKYQSRIKGRVIDDKGQPVANANIWLDVSSDLYTKLCGSKNNSVWSDKEGNFVHEEHCTVARRTVSLYIAPPIEDNSQAPIYPPFDALRKNNVKFSGLPVPINGNEEINVGDVRLQVYYNTFNLFILDNRGTPYFKNEDEWANLKLLVKDEKGNFAGSEAISIRDYETAVNARKGFVTVSLPEGKWHLELLSDWDDFDSASNQTRHYLAKTTIVIEKNRLPAPARLFVTQKKQSKYLSERRY